MTLNQLIDQLQAMVHESPPRGELPLYFDTDARKFDYHMARIGSVFCEDSPEMEGMQGIFFYEKRYRMDEAK